MTGREGADVTTVTIGIPGGFTCFLGGTGIMAGQRYSADEQAEAGARLLVEAYDRAERRKVGRKGVSWRTTLSGSPALVRAALDCLDDYAEVCAEGARQHAEGYPSYTDDYREGMAEHRAAVRVRQVVREARAGLDPGARVG